MTHNDEVMTLYSYKNSKGECMALPDNDGMTPISEVNMRRWKNATKVYVRLNALDNADSLNKSLRIRKNIREALYDADRLDIVEIYDALDKYYGFKVARQFLDVVHYSECDCGVISDSVHKLDEWSSGCEFCRY